MKVTRYESIGIKQAIRYQDLEKTANLMLAGLDVKAIRQELHSYLSVREGEEVEKERSDEARSFAVSNLMKVWVSPDNELLLFRDAALGLLREQPSMALAIHWAMVSAAYPIWFNVARQVGRLFNLQDKVTQQQIINRIKEQYGDRPTVTRIVRFIIRSYIGWGVLKDSEAKGCYEKSSPNEIVDPGTAVLLYESALHATPDGKGALGLLVNSPAFFPFQLPVLTGDFVAQRAPHIDVVRYGLDDELLRLNI